MEGGESTRRSLVQLGLEFPKSRWDSLTPRQRSAAATFAACFPTYQRAEGQSLWNIDPRVSRWAWRMRKSVRTNVLAKDMLDLFRSVQASGEAARLALVQLGLDFPKSRWESLTSRERSAAEAFAAHFPTYQRAAGASLWNIDPRVCRWAWRMRTGSYQLSKGMLELFESVPRSFSSSELPPSVQVDGEPDAGSSSEDISFSADLELLRTRGVDISEDLWQSMTRIQRRTCAMLARQSVGSAEALVEPEALRLTHLLRLPEMVQKLFQTRAPYSSADVSKASVPSASRSRRLLEVVSDSEDDSRDAIGLRQTSPTLLPLSRYYNSPAASPAGSLEPPWPDPVNGRDSDCLAVSWAVPKRSNACSVSLALPEPDSKKPRRTIPALGAGGVGAQESKPPPRRFCVVSDDSDAGAEGSLPAAGSPDRNVLVISPLPSPPAIPAIVKRPRGRPRKIRPPTVPALNGETASVKRPRGRPRKYAPDGSLLQPPGPPRIASPAICLLKTETSCDAPAAPCSALRLPPAKTVKPPQPAAQVSEAWLDALAETEDDGAVADDELGSDVAPHVEEDSSCEHSEEGDDEDEDQATMTRPKLVLLRLDEPHALGEVVELPLRRARLAAFQNLRSAKRQLMARQWADILLRVNSGRAAPDDAACYYYLHRSAMRKLQPRPRDTLGRLTQPELVSLAVPLQQVSSANWPKQLLYLPYNITPRELRLMVVAGDLSRLRTPPSLHHLLELRPLRRDHPAFPGLGVFAARHIRAGTTLGPYSGLLRSRASTHMSRSRFIAALTASTDIDAELAGNELRFINDFRNTGSCANCGYDRVRIDGKLSLVIKTTRGVLPGAELLVDYGEEYWVECVDLKLLEQ